MSDELKDIEVDTVNSDPDLEEVQMEAECDIAIETPKKITKKDGFMDFIVAAGAAVIVFMIMTLFVTPSVVVGESMYPTYDDGDRFFVVRDWLVSEYEYGDVVCADVQGMTIIKRVIGLPGDTIEIKDDVVYRNGEKVDESEYLQDGVKTEPLNIMKKFVLGDDQYFLLGDNRENSQDSRSFGPFDELKGKTFFFFKKGWFK